MALSPKRATDVVSTVYQLIEKASGSIGGNAYQSAMYGELTKGSMQKVRDFARANNLFLIRLSHRFWILCASTVV